MGVCAASVVKPTPRPERFGYAELLGEAAEPGAAMGLKEDGEPWNVPMLKEGGRVFTAWEATCWAVNAGRVPAAQLLPLT